MTLRAGLLGAGFIGKTHAARLNAIDGVDLVAVCDRQPARLKDLDAGVRGYDDFDAMLTAEDLDLLYVCLPPFAHGGEVERAAGCGLHVFLEKPIALDSRRAAAMVEAIEDAGVKSQVGFHLRFLKSVQRLQALITAGDAGCPTLFTGRYWANMDGADWWRDKARSGGQVFEQVIHLYDLARYLFGDAVAVDAVLANHCHRNQPDYTIEDTSAAMLRFANGATGVITGSNCAVPMHFFGDCRAVFEHVTFDLHSTGQAWIQPDTATLYYGSEERDVFVEDDDLYRLESEDFIEAILTDRPTRTPAREGLEAVQLVETILAAAAE